MNYRRDIEPENKQELMRRDQEFRASVGKMSKVERQSLRDTISETFRISKETASKWISPTANPNLSPLGQCSHIIRTLKSQNI